MTPLELQQRGLLDLIKRRGATPTDPYLSCVAGSPGLAMIREIAIWWREFQISVQCYFSSHLLKHLGSFDSLVTNYFNGRATSPFVEALSREFLLFLQDQANPLVRSVSEFERAFLEVRAGSQESFEVLWDRNPDAVFLALNSGGPLPARESSCVYRLRIGRDLPGTFQCTRESV
jgi:hypothetical protein